MVQRETALRNSALQSIWLPRWKTMLWSPSGSWAVGGQLELSAGSRSTATKKPSYLQKKTSDFLWDMWGREGRAPPLKPSLRYQATLATCGGMPNIPSGR